ncbi:MAG: pyridoxamine 5'-phosphate oxidase family protein [Anaerocolumna sp.]
MMEQIRYKQRICTDKEKIETFLIRTRTGVLAMSGGKYPYAVPLNYVWNDGVVYFHGMGSGKKEDILTKDPPVTFTVYQDYGTVKDPMPCHADTSYMSVMIFGKAVKVTEPEEAALVLQKLVDKFMPEFYGHPLTGNLIEKYRSSMDGRAVSVYRILPQEMTAKENSAEPERIFHP